MIMRSNSPGCIPTLPVTLAFAGIGGSPGARDLLPPITADDNQLALLARSYSVEDQGDAGAGLAARELRAGSHGPVGCRHGGRGYGPVGSLKAGDDPAAHENE